jgi:hypothetical protein
VSQYRQESLGHVICAKEIHCEEPFERGAIAQVVLERNTGIERWE